MATIVAGNSGVPYHQSTLWLGDFYQPYSGALAVNQYPILLTQTTSNVQINSDTPPPGCKYYARVTVNDTDLPSDPSPRTQFQSPFNVVTNDQVQFDFWIRMGYQPSVPTGKFFVLTEIFGSPYSGSPQMSININNNGDVAFKTEQYPTTTATLWQTPLLLNTWMRFSIQALISTDPTVGWASLAFANDGTASVSPQTLTLGSQSGTQISMQTLNKSSSVVGVNCGIYPTCYRSRGLETTSVVDFAGYQTSYLT